jgi:hypothetical protein
MGSRSLFLPAFVPATVSTPLVIGLILVLPDDFELLFATSE